MVPTAGFVLMVEYGTPSTDQVCGLGLYQPYSEGTGAALTQDGASVYKSGFNDGAWHLCEVSVIHGTYYLYIDGVLQASTGMGTHTILNGVLSFGNNNSAPDAPSQYIGSLAEVRIATVGLSANYVATNYAIQTSTTLVAAGTPTAAPTPGTMNALYQRVCPLTINGTLIAESGTYAVLFDGSGDTFGTRLPDELFTRCQSNGGDIVFTSDAAGVNILPMELVWIDTSAKTCEIWVAVPLTAGTSNTIYVWYQNHGTTLAQPLAYAPNGSQAVWDAVGNMSAVYHFGTASAWSGADSSSNGNTLAMLGYTSGGWAGEFGGSTAGPSDTDENQAGVYGNNLPSGSDPRTLQTWFKITNLAATAASIGGWGENVSRQALEQLVSGHGPTRRGNGRSRGDHDVGQPRHQLALLRHDQSCRQHEPRRHPHVS